MNNPGTAGADVYVSYSRSYPCEYQCGLFTYREARDLASVVDDYFWGEHSTKWTHVSTKAPELVVRKGALSGDINRVVRDSTCGTLRTKLETCALWLY